MQVDGALRDGERDRSDLAQAQPRPVQLIQDAKPGAAPPAPDARQDAAAPDAPDQPPVSTNGEGQATGRIPVGPDAGERRTPASDPAVTPTIDGGKVRARDPMAEGNGQGPNARQDPDQSGAQSANRTAGNRRDPGGGGGGRDHASRLPWFKRSSWWRATFRNNFSLEYELDAKIDRLQILLASLPEAVVPTMSPELRAELRSQLQIAGWMLAECEPFERVMQRINFVEAEIMMRLAEDRISLALEALRADASISLPEPASRAMLEEIDTIAASGEDPASRKVKLVGLKARLGASVIELFRGGERTRDATQFLGGALIALLVFVGWLFYQNDELSRELFTHHSTPVTVLASNAGNAPAVTDPAADVAQQSNESQAAGEAAPDPERAPAAPVPETVEAGTATSGGPMQALPMGDSPLIGLAFPVVLMAAAFGGIGACLSGLFSFTLQGRVPNEYEGWFRTAIRPTIGMASGFLAVFMLRGGLFTFGEDLAWIAIVALVFGFSERLFMGTMARLEGLPR